VLSLSFLFSFSIFVLFSKSQFSYPVLNALN
jgi:hypothetical protein